MSVSGNGNGTKAITETVRALSGTPMLLVLVVINVLILGMLTYLLKVRGEGLSQERSELIQTLSNCIEQLDGQDVHTR